MMAGTEEVPREEVLELALLWACRLDPDLAEDCLKEVAANNNWIKMSDGTFIRERR